MDNCDCLVKESDGVPGIAITELPEQSTAVVYLTVDEDGEVTVEAED